MIHPYTDADLERGKQIVRALHGVDGFDGWAEYIAKHLAAERERATAAPELLDALLSCQCPGGGWNGMPIGTEPTVGNCIKAGACGCDCGKAIAKATGAATR